jgi:hypothetical protein
LCVITYVEDDKGRPSKKLLEQMWERNSHGAGIAWRETGEFALCSNNSLHIGKQHNTNECLQCGAPLVTDNHTVVQWRKNLKLSDVIKAVKTTPLPYALHFRSASSGGQYAELTHPFVVTTDAPLLLSGYTVAPVLFHNGTWADWDNQVMKETIENNRQVPNGRWSDSRAIAWLCAYHGNAIFQVLGKSQRGVILGTDFVSFADGPTGCWKDVDGVLCSNDLFVPNTPVQAYNNGVSWGRTMCKDTRCVNKHNLDTDGYCPIHSKETAIARPTARVLHTGGGAISNVSAYSKPHAFWRLDILVMLHARGVVSKSLLKKYRKAHSELSDKTKEPKATELLVKYCQQVRETPVYQAQMAADAPNIKRIGGTIAENNLPVS